jgi:hypothetical protein
MWELDYQLQGSDWEISLKFVFMDTAEYIGSELVT